MNKNFLLIIFFVLLINIIIIFLSIYNETMHILIVKKNNLNENIKEIKKNLLQRNLIPIENKYKIIKDRYDFSDFHIVMYWNNDHNCKIIIRRLDDDKIVNPFMICIYNIKQTEKIYINIQENNTNEIIFNYETSFKLKKTFTNQEQNIPKIIIQTTKSNQVSKACYSAIQTFIDLNPEYEYKLYDDNDCIEFIKTHFDEHVLNMYNKLIPGAYKADLFRYCVLYITGGCYFDIKQILRVPLRDIIDKDEKIILTEDYNPTTYFNAIMLVEKNNPLMLKLINQVVINVKNDFYGTCPLCPTGPCLLYKIAKHIKPKFFYKPFYSEVLINKLRSKATIKYKNKSIINVNYHGYYKLFDKNYYAVKWHMGEIFNKISD